MISLYKHSIQQLRLSSIRFVSLSSETIDKNNKRIKNSNSFCMNLFRGKAALDTVFPYPLNLNTEQRETLQMILSPTEKFLTEVNNPYKNDAEANTPFDVLKKFAEFGAFGAVVPEEFDGAGLNNTQMARLGELVGFNDLSLGVIMGAHQSIGYKGILLFGSESQKKKYLPDLATGRKFAAFCLTEPSSGSDANSICTRAVKSDCGKFYIINGGKIWISNGGFADIFTVFAQTKTIQKDGTKKDKVSAFIVDRNFGGVTNGPPEKKMGIKGSNTAEVHFENVKVPVENLLGDEGEGFKIAMNILNNGRFGIPAACTGSMKYCIKKSIDHINNRVQFGKKLRDFGNVQEKITDMIIRHYVTESILYILASNMDRGIKDYQLEAAIAKIVASENAWHVCDESIQLHGGMGFMWETGLERVLRDLRVFRIFEGANDVLKLFVALTGIQYAGKHLLQLSHDIKSGSIKTLFGEVKRRAFGNTGNDIVLKVHPSLKEGAIDVTKSIKEFGSASEALLGKHRRGIIDRQYELIRLANAAIDIYSMVSVLSRCSFALEKGNATYEQQIAQLFLRQASKRVFANIEEACCPSVTGMRLIEQISQNACDNSEIVLRHLINL